MSLSKYYQSSDSFKPEKIVKQDGSRNSGWTPLARAGENPSASARFTADKDLPKHPGADAPSPKPPHPEEAVESPLEPEIEKPEANVPPPPEIIDPSTEPEKQLDMSGYVELAVAERKSEEAYRQGVAKGLKDGLDKAEQEFGAATRALLLACSQLDSLRETIISNSSTELLDFALAIAEKILHVSVREQDATIVATIEEALRRAVKSDEFSIFIHPDDYAAVSEKAAEIVAGISGLNNIVLRKDTAVERGGAKIESDNCTIDATISGQFELIREEVKKKV